MEVCWSLLQGKSSVGFGLFGLSGARWCCRKDAHKEYLSLMSEQRVSGAPPELKPALGLQLCCDR